MLIRKLIDSGGFFYRLILLVIGSFLISSLIITIVVNISLNRESLRQTKQLLSQDMLLIHSAIKNSQDYVYHLKRISTSISHRITLIDPYGKVTFDNRANPETMDNHISRPEIQQALKEGKGSSFRYSKTTHTKMLYIAQVLPDRTFLRLSVPLIDIRHQFNFLKINLSIVIVFIFLLTLFTVLFYSRNFLKPFEQITKAIVTFSKTGQPQKVFTNRKDELGQLASAYNDLAEDLDQHIKTIEKQSQETQAILKGLDEGVIAVDEEDFVIYYNQAAGQLLENPIHQYSNKKLSEIVFQTPLIELVKKTRLNQKTYHQEITLPGSKPKTLLLSTTPISEIKGVVMVLKDMTQIKQLENYRKDFVANVSHELKTPITSIQGSVETLRDLDPKDENFIKFINMIEKNAKRLDQLISDILTLTRIDDEIEADTESIDLKKILADILEVIEIKFKKKNHQVAIESSPEPVLFEGNPEEIRQAMSNYIDNAIKYCPPDSQIKIELTIKNEQIYFCVQDNGPGIPVEQHPRLFERFYRVDKGRSISMGGTGLGLSIVKNIIEKYGGQVGVKGAPGQGSQFYFYLPYIKESYPTKN